MTERKFTDEKIIKAFELCFAKTGTNFTCYRCPYHKYGNLCKVERNRDALDLINLQKSEIERLKKALDTDFSFVGTRCSGKTKRATEIIKFRVETIKAEAVKEFAERLKDKAMQKFDWNEYVEVDTIDNLVKEMLAEKCENQDENLRKNVKVIGE